MEKETIDFKLDEMRNMIDIAKAVDNTYYEFSDSEHNFKNKKLLLFIFVKNKLKGFRVQQVLEYGTFGEKFLFPAKFMLDIQETKRKTFQIYGEQDYILRFEPSTKSQAEIEKLIEQFKKKENKNEIKLK